MMSVNDGPKEPSRPTVKRLFALSGNRCAFPECPISLVDPKSGSVIGEMCHIKGEKLGAARYDDKQTNEQRHGFDNLILLCKVHHKIVDDDEPSHTVERLILMKQQHETRHTGPSPENEATAERFISEVIAKNEVHGSVITSNSQTGGQIAHLIQNFYGTRRQIFRVATHVGTTESLDVSNCEWHGRPSSPEWFMETPEKISSRWLSERLIGQADLRLCFDPRWCGGTWFVVDVDRGDGEVLNLDQLADLKPSSPTTTTTSSTTTTQAPD